MDFSYTVLQNANFLGFWNDFRWMFTVLQNAPFSRIFRWFQMDFAHTLLQNAQFFQDLQMILAGLFVHYFAECSIFPGFSDDFSWIFRTLFCRMIQFPGFSDDFSWIFRTLFCRIFHFPGCSDAFRCIFRTLFCRVIHFSRVFEMILDGFFVHCFAECSRNSRIFRWF